MFQQAMSRGLRGCLVLIAVLPITAMAGMAAPGSLLECSHQGAGVLYDVGPGQAYTAIGQVPWENLGAGDTVRIHGRLQPYREKILIRGQGTAAQPIVVCGVPGADGARPVLDGENSTTRPSMGYRVVGTEPRGLIHVSWGAGDAWGYKPRHIVIQGLHLRHAFHEYGFTASNGQTLTYNPNAAGIFVERGENIRVRDVVLEGNGNGFFVASGDSEEVLSRNILIEYSWLHGNGTVTVSNDRHHNLYTEAVGMTIQFNRFGPLRSGAQGSMLKDRSTQTVIRYNWIDGGARSIDLVEAQDSWPMVQALPEYRRAYVYGNVLISNPNGPSYMVHYGGDSGLLNTYRKGRLHFFHNTVVVRANQSGAGGRWRTVLFDVSTNEEQVDARNNVLYVRSATAGALPTNVAWMRSEGVLDLGTNWASPSVAAWRDGIVPTGTITGLGNVLSNAGNAPGFFDEPMDLFDPAADSALIDVGMALHPEAVSQGHLLNAQYRLHADGSDRPTAGALDLGAFEFWVDATVFADGFESTATLHRKVP